MQPVVMLLVSGVIMFSVIGGLSLLAHYYTLNGIKSKTVGDGQHGTARFATKKEIEETYVEVAYEPEKWRKGENLPTAQGLVLGSIERAGKLYALVDTGDVHCLMIGAAGVGKTAHFLYPNIEYACACGMSFLTTDTKGDLYRNYAGIAKKYYGYHTAVIDLRNPTRSDGDNMLHLVNKYMDEYLADHNNLSAKAKAEKYAKITAKTIISSGGADSASYGQNAFFYDAAEGVLTAVILLIAEFCPKENSIHEIILKIKKEFHEDNEEMIRKDVENLLHEMWCRGYIEWKDKYNPFLTYYEQKKDRYTYCIGNLDLLEKYETRIGGVEYTDIHYNRDVILGKDFLYSTYLNGLNTVFALKEGEKELLRLFVNLDVPGRRVYIRHMEVAVELTGIYEVYRDFIEWSCKELIRKNCIESRKKHICNCIMVTDSKDVNNIYLEEIGFQFKGELTKEVYVDEEYKDASVFVKTICL